MLKGEDKDLRLWSQKNWAQTGSAIHQPWDLGQAICVPEPQFPQL